MNLSEISSFPKIRPASIRANPLAERQGLPALRIGRKHETQGKAHRVACTSARLRRTVYLDYRTILEDSHLPSGRG